MYEPKEDSYLILEYIKEYARGSVLDIGTGSGILAIEAAKYADKVMGADIDKELIANLNKKYKDEIKNLTFIYADLFGDIKNRKFDLIIFNPPYLPQDKDIDDKTIYGGKEGYEIIERFLNNVKKYLKKEGKILLLFSSLTDKTKVDTIINKNKLKFKEIEKKRMFFEELYVYLIFN